MEEEAQVFGASGAEVRRQLSALDDSVLEVDCEDRLGESEASECAHAHSLAQSASCGPPRVWPASAHD
eukprot:7376632-Prymnesium_polylepis.3